MNTTSTPKLVLLYTPPVNNVKKRFTIIFYLLECENIRLLGINLMNEVKESYTENKKDSFDHKLKILS